MLKAFAWLCSLGRRSHTKPLSRPMNSEPVQSWAFLQSDAPTPLDLIRQHRLDEAEALLMRQLRLQQWNRQVLTQLAQLSEMRNDWDNAYKWWTSIRLEPTRRWEVEIHLVRVIARQGRQHVAKLMLLKLLKSYERNPGIVTASSNLVEEFTELDQQELLPVLIKIINQYEERNGDDAQTLVAKAKIATIQGRWQDAFQYSRRALLIRPQDVHLQGLVAEAAKGAGVPLASASEAKSTQTGRNDDPIE